MQALPRSAGGTVSINAAGKLALRHQQSTSNRPAADAAQALGRPHSGHSGARSGVERGSVVIGRDCAPIGPLRRTGPSDGRGATASQRPGGSLPPVCRTRDTFQASGLTTCGSAGSAR